MGDKGHRNTGNRNTGNRNTGNRNTGNRNTGNRNTGDFNTENRNTGDWNAGDRNTGNRNIGNRNTGDFNTGGCNTGGCNTGNRNTGDFNTGNWNTCNKETGYFNTEVTKTIRVFNKECSLDEWNKSVKPLFLYFILTEWVFESNMTDQEKIYNKTFHTTGGYLKSYKYKEAFQKAYDESSEEEKNMLLRLPNFDAGVFKEISGIDVMTKDICAGKIVEIDGKRYKLEEIPKR